MGWLRGLLLETGISILERPPEVMEATLPLGGPRRTNTGQTDFAEGERGWEERKRDY